MLVSHNYITPVSLSPRYCFPSCAHWLFPQFVICFEELEVHFPIVFCNSYVLEGYLPIRTTW